MPLRFFVVSLEDVKKMHARIQTLVIEEGERSARAFLQQPNETNVEFATRLQNWRDLHRINVVITGYDQATLEGDITQLDSPNRPLQIAGINMTNTTLFLKVFNRAPINAFSFNLDFTKPPPLDLLNPISGPTPNNSHVTVEGERDAWISSIIDAVTGIVDKKRTRRGWLHKAIRYDAVLWFIVLPIAFYACWRFSGWINSFFGSIHPVIVVAAYFYLGFGVIWIYRLLFGYAKWAFPTAELTDNNDAAGKHRAAWWALVLGILAGVIVAAILGP